MENQENQKPHEPAGTDKAQPTEFLDAPPAMQDEQNKTEPEIPITPAPLQVFPANEPAYAHPEVLVTTDWVLEHLTDPRLRIVEIDVDTKAYDVGHIPGAIGFNWQTQLQDPVRRDILSREEFEKLLGDAGISPRDTVVLYGDNSNWFAAYGFWLFKLYGHEDVRLMNGGRAKWLNEPDKPLAPERPSLKPVKYRVKRYRKENRALLEDVLNVLKRPTADLLDVRSREEFAGRIIAPPGMNETAQRGGHIPGARNVPWSQAVNPDGTFRSVEELRALYLNNEGFNPDRPVIAYCRIGERSSHTWFVLKYLLGFENVKNYDGSWTEYGNLVAAPIEKMAA